MCIWGKGRASGRVGSDFMSAVAGRVGSGRVQENDNSAAIFPENIIPAVCGVITVVLGVCKILHDDKLFILAICCLRFATALPTVLFSVEFSSLRTSNGEHR